MQEESSRRPCLKELFGFFMEILFLLSVNLTIFNKIYVTEEISTQAP